MFFFWGGGLLKSKVSALERELFLTCENQKQKPVESLKKKRSLNAFIDRVFFLRSKKKNYKLIYYFGFMCDFVTGKTFRFDSIDKK